MTDGAQDMTDRLAKIRERAEKATPGPWAYESVAEKHNDYRVGIVCPVSSSGDVGTAISGNVKTHSHYWNGHDFGEWYCEEIASLDEVTHSSDGSCSADAAFVAHAREDIPFLLDHIAELEVEPSPYGRIASLEAEIERLQEVLRPFALFFKSDEHDLSPANDATIAATFLGEDRLPLAELTIAHFRQADAALKGDKP